MVSFENLRTRIPVLLLAVSFALTSIGIAASEPPDSDFDVIEINPGSFVHVGRMADLNDPERADSANIGFVIGEKCIAVIDTGGAVSTGRRLREAIRQRSALPICYVINTHIHFDHVLGNAAFVSDEPEFIGHANLQPAIEGNRTFFAEEFGVELGQQGEQAIVGPSRLVESEADIDLGGRVLSLKAHPTAHSGTDLSVYDAETGTLWTGDLVFMERLPIIDGTLKGWLAWIERTEGRPIKHIVPGHGPAFAPWPTAVTPQKNYLLSLLNEARAAISEGMFLEDAIEKLGIEAKQSWQLNGRHSRNVSKAYRELEWE